MAYTLDYISNATPVAKGDEVVEQDGIRVQIDSKALMYVVGTRMDYVGMCRTLRGTTFVVSLTGAEDAVRAEFVFENPNASGTCGCGESFNVDNKT